jgi:hypothetical protein
MGGEDVVGEVKGVDSTGSVGRRRPFLFSALGLKPKVEKNNKGENYEKRSVARSSSLRSMGTSSLLEFKLK